MTASSKIKFLFENLYAFEPSAARWGMNGFYGALQNFARRVF